MEPVCPEFVYMTMGVLHNLCHQASFSNKNNTVCPMSYSPPAAASSVHVPWNVLVVFVLRDVCCPHGTRCITSAVASGPLTAHPYMVMPSLRGSAFIVDRCDASALREYVFSFHSSCILLIIWVLSPLGKRTTENNCQTTFFYQLFGYFRANCNLGPRSHMFDIRQ